METQNFVHKYFTIGEFLSSDKAVENKINNCKTTKEIELNIHTLIEKVLDPAREELGAPIFISSGFRCEALNKLVEGVSNSQHKTGEAADLRCKDVPTLRKLFGILQNYEVDQLLYEKNSKGSLWIHVSFRRDGNNRSMIIDNYLSKK